MSVILETSVGLITVDLYTDVAPLASLNFLKLCKLKYYNFNCFHRVETGFIAESGDPTATGRGGQSIWHLLDGTKSLESHFFRSEISETLTHAEVGTVGMSSVGLDANASQVSVTANGSALPSMLTTCGRM